MPKAKKKTAAVCRCAIESLESRRLLSFGSLIPSFGGTGVVDIPETSSGLSFNAVATAVQTDGKIVVVGTTSDHRVGVARFDTNGTLDSTFGTGGETLFHFSSHQDVGKAVAIEASGYIIVAGSENAGNKGAIDSPNSENSQIAVACLTPSGKLYTPFGSNGIFTRELSNYLGGTSAIAGDVLIQPNGAIVVVGTVGNSTLLYPHVDDDFVAMRLLGNGVLDTTFNGDGIKEIDLGGPSFPDYDFEDFAYAAAIDTNGTPKTNPNYGKIVIVGQNQPDENTSQQFGLVRLNTNGSVDDSFGGGPILTPFGGGGYTQSIARSVVIMPNDDVVIAGQVWSGSPGATTDFGLMAFKSNGAVDDSFGSNGTVETDFGGKNDAASSIIISQSGDLIVGGSSGGTLAMAAYTPTGHLDATFGSGGKITSSQPAISGMAIAADGTFVATSSVNSTTEAFYDTVPIAAVGSLDSSASEQGPTTATFLVTLSTRVSFDRDVYINISGSAILANVATVKFKTADYSLSGIVVPLALSGSTTPFVVIPADDTFALVTLTPIDNPRVTSDQTAIFSIVSNPSYDIQSTEATTTLTIHDNPPATERFNATGDAYVRDGSYANTNFGTALQLVVKDGPTGLNRLSYITFNLSSLSSVNSVNLQLYGELSAANSTPIATQVFGVSNTSWSETGITYNNKPASTGSSLGTIAVSNTTLNLYTLDLTAYVKQQFAAGHKIVSLLIKSSVSSNPSVEFNSREANDGPQLIVS
jgi:uncharacterized delta-60 repeat protein